MGKGEQVSTPHTYRLTEDEYARYLTERDETIELPADIATEQRLVREANGAWVVDGTHASALYDSGAHFYWVKTLIPVPWA
jgi:hypothetical protein